jgi:hypothetical protein
MYYKNANNDLFVDPIVSNHVGLVEITKEEFEALVEEKNKPTPEQLLAEAKALKVQALNTLTVTTTAGNTFDGNESARTNMMSAIQSSDFLGVTETEWKMADNSIVLITLEELKEALALSIQAVGVIVKDNQ